MGLQLFSNEATYHKVHLELVASMRQNKRSNLVGTMEEAICHHVLGFLMLK